MNEDDKWGSELIEEAFERLRDPYLGTIELALYEKANFGTKKKSKTNEFMEGFTAGYLAAVKAEREMAANTIIRNKNKSRPWYWSVQDIIEGRKI